MDIQNYKDERIKNLEQQISNLECTHPKKEIFAATVRDLESALHDRTRELEKIDFHEWYKNYLKSDKWRCIRLKIVTRCSNTCEGCGENKVDEVHHITYAHAGNEFLFELLGLCKSCHAKLHAEIN